MARLGWMRHLAMLQRPVHGQDPDGSTVITWADIRRIYVSLAAAGADESEQSGQVEASITWSLMVYHSPLIQPQHRLVFEDDGRVFEIISITPEAKAIPVFAVVTAREVLT